MPQSLVSPARISNIRISLDQNFLWGFAKRKNPALVKLHESLERAVQDRKIICPIHVYETIFESSMLPLELQQGIFTIAGALSDRTGFHHFGSALSFETMALARPQFRWPPLQRGILLQPDAHQSAETRPIGSCSAS
jgi:hypothetical protein